MKEMMLTPSSDSFESLLTSSPGRSSLLQGLRIRPAANPRLKETGPYFTVLRDGEGVHPWY